METTINVFHSYSNRVGHFDMLSLGEFKQLLEKEFPHWLKVRRGGVALSLGKVGFHHEDL